jgi:hypothetical protein
MLATEQEKMSVSGLHVENNQFLHRLAIPRDEEELSHGIRPYIQGKAAPRPLPPDPLGNCVAKFHSCTHLLEGTFQRFHLHSPI